jgi:hypothetical protein
MLLDQHHIGCSSSPDIGDLAKALVEAQKSFKPVAKSEEYKIGPGKSYWYSTWKDICDAVLPSLLANGIIFLPRNTITTHGWTMVGTLIHASTGQWISSTCPIRDALDSHGVRQDSQSFEIGVTYAKKTLLMSLAGAWAAGDEQVEQDSAKESEAIQEVDHEAAALDAKRAKVEAALKLVANNPKKLADYLAKVDALVEKGELRQADAEWLKEQFPLPEEQPKKEKANA